MAMKLSRLPHGFNLDTAAAALKLTEAAVRDIQTHSTPRGWKTTGQVHDAGVDYTATAELNSVTETRLIDCQCTCGEARCKHVAALILHSEPLHQPLDLDPELIQWLHSFLHEEVQPRTRQHELRFILTRQAISTAGRLHPVQRVTLQMMRIPIRAGVPQVERAEPYIYSKKQAFASPLIQKDQDLLQLIEAATTLIHLDGQWQEKRYLLTDQLISRVLIEVLLETGRLCWETIHQPLRKGPLLQAMPTWSTDSTGIQTPSLMIETLPSAIILPLSHPWAVDPQHMTLSAVEVIGPPDRTAKFLSGPEVLPNQAAALAKAIDEMNMSLPRPHTKMIQQILPLQIQLQLSARRIADQIEPVAELVFLYASTRAKGHADSIIAAANNELIQSPRDLKAELEAHQKIMSLGFVQAGDVFLRSDHAAWLSFLQTEQDELTDIEVVIHPDFPLRFAQVKQWYGDVSETNDGLTLDLGVLVDGERLSLMTLFPWLIEHQPELFQQGGLDKLSDDDLIFAQLPDGRLLPLPVGRVRAIIGIFVELHQKSSQPLKLSLLDAARITQLEHVLQAQWSGADHLFSLGQKMLDFEGITPVEAPRGLQAELRSYQQQGLSWLQFLREYNIGGILADDMGLGKAQPLDAKVLTPQGWRLMETLCVHDMVIGYDGQATKITGVYPQGERDIYRITLNDGYSTRADADHLWWIFDQSSWQLKTTRALSKGMQLPLFQPALSAHSQKDLYELARKYHVHDGIFPHDAADEVIALVQSMGGVAQQTEQGIITSFPPEKAAELNWQIRTCTRSIETIEHEGLQQAQCISIEADHHLYVTDHYIVTHNTLQTLTHLLLEKEQGRAKKPTLIITPTSVIDNWQVEAKRFTPDLSVAVLYGKNRSKEIKNLESADIILTTYSLLTRDIFYLKKLNFYYIILDEAQNIKNSKTSVSKAALLLQSTHRLCLTGTPLENNLSELWSQFQFLTPGLLYDEKTFKQFYRMPIEKKKDVIRQQYLSQRVKPFILRREKKDVAQELPSKTEIIIHLHLEGDQRDLYETVRETMQGKIQKELKLRGFSYSTITMLQSLLKLRQVVIDPRLLKLNHLTEVKHNAKLQWLQHNLPQMLKEGRKILIFSSFSSMIHLLEEALKEEGILYSKITGKTKDRTRQIDQFQSGQTNVFLITLKAGGVGLNLTAADTVIHYDPWWNPAAEDQATDRAYRIGQDKPVFVYKLITAGSVEERILELQGRKETLSRGILEGGLSDVAELSQQDIERLFEPLES